MKPESESDKTDMPIEKRIKQSTPQFICQPVRSGGASGLPKLKLTEFNDPLEWPEWSGFFMLFRPKESCWCWKCEIPEDQSQGLSENSIMGVGKGIIGMSFSSQSYYHLWYTVYEKWDRSDYLINTQLRKIHTHHPIRNGSSSSTVKNTLTQLGYTSDLDSEGGLCSAVLTRKLCPRLWEHWLQ